MLLRNETFFTLQKSPWKELAKVPVSTWAQEVLTKGFIPKFGDLVQGNQVPSPGMARICGGGCWLTEVLGQVAHRPRGKQVLLAGVLTIGYCSSGPRLTLEPTFVAFPMKRCF